MMRLYQSIVLYLTLPAVLQAALIAHYDFSDGDLLDNEVGADYTLRAMKSTDISPRKVHLNRLEGMAVFMSGGRQTPWLEADGPGSPEQFTVSFWFRTDQVCQWTDYAGLFSSDTDAGEGNWMVFSGAHAGGALNLLWRGSDAPAEAHAPGVWQHVVVRQTGGVQPRIEMTITPLGGIPGEPVVSHAHRGTFEKIVLGNNHRLHNGYRMEMANVKIFDDADVSVASLFKEGPGTRSFDNVPFFSAKKTLRLLEREAALLRAELKRLPTINNTMPFDAFGYHSDYLPALDVLPQQPRWTVEIGEAGRFAGLFLVPATDRRGPTMPGYGFPKRFRLLTVSEDGRERVFADWRKRDFPDPGRFPARFPASGGEQGKIILEVYRGATESGREFFALDEILVCADHFVLKTEPVKASGSFESLPFWSVDYLTDERTSLGPPVRPAAAGTVAWRDFSWKFSSAVPERVAIDFDFGEDRQVNVVSLFPARAPEGILIQGYGFPEAVEMRMFVASSEGEKEEVYLNNIKELARPGNNTVRILGQSKKARWLRLIFDEFPKYRGRYTFALGEIDVFGISESLGRDAEVSMTLLGTDQNVGYLDALTDGLAGDLEVLPLIHWLDGLNQSRVLTHHLDRVMTLQDDLLSRRARVGKTVRITGLSLLVGTLLAVAGTALMLRRRHARNMNVRIEAERRQTEMEQIKIRFFTHISHELRTPLTLILGPLEKALGRERDPGQEKSLSLAHRNVKKLQALVDQLLDFRKLQDGRLVLEWSAVNLRPFIHNGFEVYQSMAADRRISYRLICSDNDSHITIDPGKLQVIMDNLISNALKYTPEGGRVTVEAGVSGGAPSQWLEFSVEDNGVGIAEADLPHVFEQYFRADGLDAIQAKGSGIGLAYVKGLVDLWGGEIVAESPVADGRGTRFRVKLPVREQSAQRMEQSVEYPEVQPAFSEAIPEVSGSAQQSPPLVLIVEDSEDIREFVRMELEGDYRVMEAENGRIGLDLALEHQPDLVLSDVMMPEMDGIEMCRRIKADEKTSHLPVIMLTARGSQEHQLEGLKTGADDYVSKPFSMPILLARIHNLLEARRKLRERFAAPENMVVEPSEITVTPADEEFMQRAIDVVEEHMDDFDFTVEAFTAEMHISRTALYMKLKALTGQTPNEFIRILRLKRSAQLLKSTSEGVAEVAARVGFLEPTNFSRAFKGQFGVSPTEYRKNS
jgi:signal transduction histidine kinase/DNA-binding response OmpR family regulator